MKPLARFVIFFALWTAVFSSCDPGRTFDQYQKIDDSAWHKDSLITFQIPVTDSLSYYNFILQVRHETSYAYSNLWLFIEIIQPGGEVMRDTFEMALAEPSGRWLGKGMGGMKTMQTNYKTNFWFPVPGEYSVSLQHGMREETLQGIHDAGIRIEKAGKRE
jgi:gliding motility-associated lipoprotein GldH